MNDFSAKKLELPHFPHLLHIHENIAFISSSSPSKDGFYFMAVDLATFSLMDTFSTPGMVSSMASDGDKVFVAINPGGPHNFGSYARILQLKIDDQNQITSTDIFLSQEELPPSFMKITQTLI